MKIWSKYITNSALFICIRVRTLKDWANNFCCRTVQLYLEWFCFEHNDLFSLKFKEIIVTRKLLKRFLNCSKIKYILYTECIASWFSAVLENTVSFWMNLCCYAVPQGAQFCFRLGWISFVSVGNRLFLTTTATTESLSMSAVYVRW